jgi:hypothetical protein
MWFPSAALCGACVLLALFVFMPLNASAQGGNKPVPATGFALVPERQAYTDIKQSAGSGSVILVLVPKGTVLPIVGRQGEWLQVTLAPELRQIGQVYRWYNNEKTGFVHESTVQVLKEKPPPQQYARVAQTNADIKQGSSSGSVVLVLVPKGTTLPIVGRQGEWLQVRLSPELRQLGTPMRWYLNEEAGFVHESLVEVIKK